MSAVSEPVFFVHLKSTFHPVPNLLQKLSMDPQDFVEMKTYSVLFKHCFRILAHVHYDVRFFFWGGGWGVGRWVSAAGDHFLVQQNEREVMQVPVQPLNCVLRARHKTNTPGRKTCWTRHTCTQGRNMLAHHRQGAGKRESQGPGPQAVSQSGLIWTLKKGQHPIGQSYSVQLRSFFCVSGSSDSHKKRTPGLDKRQGSAQKQVHTVKSRV